MLFQVTHRHSHETCPGGSSDRQDAFRTWWDGLKSNADVKVVAAYIATTDHVFHMTIEANDNGALARALGPLNTIGTGTVEPVISFDQAFPLAEAGAFQMPGR
jgi:hypothetical protein